jgi:hypothetical protein
MHNTAAFAFNYGGTLTIHDNPAPETVHTTRDVRLDDTLRSAMEGKRQRRAGQPRAQHSEHEAA